jgi:predicted small integral membrane protein
MWRAINSPFLQTAFYISIILWEGITMILCWWGGIRMACARSESAAIFQQSKGISIAAMALSLLMWLIAFLAVGGEWFLMWQSRSWNGQDAAFRMFAVIGIVLLLVAQSDASDQP